MFRRPFSASSITGHINERGRHRSASHGERHAYYGTRLESELSGDPAPLDSGLAADGGAIGRDRQPDIMPL